MNDFDLIGPLSLKAREIEQQQEEPARSVAFDEHRQSAARALLLRSQRNAPFVKRHQQFAASYVASAELITAANVALTLGRPLLLTGEPGSGKTLAAYWLAHVLDLGSVLVFNVKSESRAQDLLYSFDAVSWFRESQAAALKGLGKNVPKRRHIEAGILGTAFGWNAPPDQVRVALIDEIDKAPRDFPNDLLHELDQMSFRIAEDNKREVTCPADKRPIVVITSNQERRLPDPFLRRCVLHEIKLTDITVAEILRSRLGELRDFSAERASTEPPFRGDAEERVVKAALPVWTALKTTPNLSRTYTVDEFWRWLAIAILDVDDAGILNVANALADRKLEYPALRTLTLLPEKDRILVQAKLEANLGLT
ncbi:MoxR family ATPase [Mesorhizobium sp.]|uniref:AAA family ATPase n=1 Tax=Mesorhizobium sp. TaxID=1871066 RepID=UPI0012287CAD|nr:MoxR family ATPase [Mesorhizobium sp.]TIM05510.1 MAG: MoxR family ATPase [Mesorhizobium sp.]